MREEREKRKEKREKRKENKKTLNKNSIPIRMLSYLRAYCSMSQNFEAFSTPDKGLFLCLMCQMCQIFGI